MNSLIKAILSTGCLVGFLDGIAAICLAYFRNGVSPVRVFQFIASGFFGTQVFSGGYAMAVVGLCFHFLIALFWSAIFYLLYPRVTFLSRNWLIAGGLYGIVVLLTMQWVVLPLSNVPTQSKSIQMHQVLVHIILVGLPISFLSHRFFSMKRI
jgi:hypothetical protein